MTDTRRPITLTELEGRLAGPYGAAVHASLLAELSAAESRLARRLATLLPRAEFAALSASAEGVRAARKVLEAWLPGAGPSFQRGAAAGLHAGRP
jgi:hypothetical protein